MTVEWFQLTGSYQQRMWQSFRSGFSCDVVQWDECMWKANAVSELSGSSWVLDTSLCSVGWNMCCATLLKQEIRGQSLMLLVSMDFMEKACSFKENRNRYSRFWASFSINLYFLVGCCPLYSCLTEEKSPVYRPGPNAWMWMWNVNVKEVRIKVFRQRVPLPENVLEMQRITQI